MHIVPSQHFLPLIGEQVLKTGRQISVAGVGVGASGFMGKLIV
jgi:hypothetical protein